MTFPELTNSTTTLSLLYQLLQPYIQNDMTPNNKPILEAYLNILTIQEVIDLLYLLSLEGNDPCYQPLNREDYNPLVAMNQLITATCHACQ